MESEVKTQRVDRRIFCYDYPITRRYQLHLINFQLGPNRLHFIPLFTFTFPPSNISSSGNLHLDHPNYVNELNFRDPCAMWIMNPHPGCPVTASRRGIPAGSLPGAASVDPRGLWNQLIGNLR